MMSLTLGSGNDLAHRARVGTVRTTIDIIPTYNIYGTTTLQGRLLPTQQRSPLVDVMPSNTTLDREFRLHHHVSRSSVLDPLLVASTDRTQDRTWSILEAIGASWGKGRVWLAILHMSVAITTVTRACTSASARPVMTSFF